MVVKFHVLPPSGDDMAPPVAPCAQLPECLKLWSASLSTTETSCQPVCHVSWFRVVSLGIFFGNVLWAGCSAHVPEAHSIEM